VLIELRDPDEQARIAVAARRSVEHAHVKFTAGVLELVGVVR
jgi:hypothetical protein